MIFRNVVFFFVLASFFVAHSVQSNEYTQINDRIFPTFKETSPISAQDALLTREFQKSVYEESESFSSSTYWHKLQFPKKKTELTSSDLSLKLDYYIIDNLDFYLFHGDKLIKHWKRGASQNWNSDEDYKGIWIPINLSEQQDTILLIRKSGEYPLLTPIELLSPQETIIQKEQKQLFWTIIICSLLVLLVHNLFVFMLFRQPGYIYYLGINIVIFIALSITTGFSRWLFPEEVSQLMIKNLFFIFGVGAWIFYRFSVIFLNEVQIPSPKSAVRKYGNWGFIVFLILTQLFSGEISASFFALIEIALFFICTYWGIKAYSKGFLAVRFYLFSWLVLMVGSILSTLIFWEVLPINTMTSLIFPVCSILQLLGFAFAYADKANYLERNRQLQAITDVLTGLPNQAYYSEKLPSLLKKNTYHDSPNLALIMIEMTSYTELSQAFGPAQANAVLSDIIQRIHKKFASMDGILPLPLVNKKTKYAIRLTIKNIVAVSTEPNLLKRQIEQLQQILDHSILVNKVDFRPQYKIGSSLYPSQGETLDKLYQNALVACNTVTYGSGSWIPFTDKLQSNHAHQLRLVTLLTDDIQNEKLYFEIQPQVNLSNNKIVGGEVLLRWHNEHLGQISPGEFIPLAEQTGLIYKLTNLILEKAFQWAAEHKETLREKTLSINISALDLLQESFAKHAKKLIEKYNLNASQFTIEVTETSVFQNYDVVSSNVKQLHQAGFKLAIDDFGVGYSSMQNLVSLQTNELKIDQLFVMNLLEDQQSQILCRSMINLSKELNITSVAEGIESKEILELLQAWNCQFGQGYHLYRPMPAEDYLNLLED